MSIITITNCPVCGSNDSKKAFNGVDYFSSGDIFPVCECLNCGFRFTNGFPSEDTIGKYYDSPEYISHSDSDKGLVNRLYHYFRKRMLSRKVDLISAHAPDKPARLLDIGCGTGYFLQAAKEKGFVVSGIEKDEKAREIATARSSLEVKDEKSLWEMEDASFDAVTLWHVLEHIEKLNETVEKISEILAPKGIMALALPNHCSFDEGFYKEQWAAYDIPRHLWHFSPANVERLLANHGMYILNRFSMPLDAFYISLLSERYRGSILPVQYGRAVWIGIIGFLQSLSDIEKSSSVIYIAAKNEKICRT